MATVRARSLTAALAMALWFVFSVAAPVAAAEPPRWSYDLSRDMMSPYCPGRTLAACPSPQAAELIQWIIVQEQAGATRDEVEAQLYERFGDVMRSTPRTDGWGWTAYFVPAAVVVAGLIGVVLMLRRLSSGAAANGEGAANPSEHSTVESPKAAADDDIERLVDEELGRI